MVVVIEPILPERLIAARIGEAMQREITAAVTREMETIESLFGEGTSTWKAGDKPKWKKRIAVGLAISGTVTTGDTPFAYVEVGTRYRWRRMSKDFSPKTRPGVLGSGPGGGSAAGWFRKPMPGIKGRGFRDIIARRRERPFALRIENAITRALRSSGV